MKVYTRIFILLLLFFISCKSEKKDDKYIIGFSQFSLDSNLRKSMVQSMEIEAKLYDDIELFTLDGKGSVDKQIEDIETLIEQNVDVLIVSPIAPKPLRSAIQKAVKLNIPVIVLDRELEGVDYNSFIGADNFNIGQNSAKYLASLKENFKIIEIKGWAGTTPTLLRNQGFNNYIDKVETCEVVDVVQEIYDEPGIKKAFRKLLLEGNEFNAVFAHNDDLALQAYEVASEFNLEDKIKFIGVGGVNGEKGGLELVEKGILSSTILYPTGGKESIRVAHKILNAKEVQTEYSLPSLVVDKENVSVLKRQLDLIFEHKIDLENQQKKVDNQIKLFNDQKSFLGYVMASLGFILLLLILTFLNKRKLSKQKDSIERSKNLIESQKKKIEGIANDLKRTNEATNNFFTGVSHDFKTPISLIMSSTESLFQRDSIKKPQEYALIHNNSKRLLRMVNELLDFKKVESNKFKLKVSKINIYDFVYSIFLDFKKEAADNDIDFSIDTTDKDIFAYIDRNLFDNILFNLLSNAFKFTPIKGNIKINVRDVSAGVYVSVKDSGIGIVSSEQDKIFHQFFQGSNNKQSSSGIGLYLAKQYIELHEGNIKVLSEEGKGTEFILFIPKGKSHFKDEEIIIDTNLPETGINIDSFEFETSVNLHTNTGEQETILIIEDNTDLRVFLKNKLSESYKVYQSDGIDALEKAFELIPDIIISDVNLPEKNGFEISKILKEDQITSHVPIIMLTALSSGQAHLKGLQSGVDMFLTKPFNLSVLYQSIQSLLYNRKKLQLYYNHTQSKSQNLIVDTEKDKNIVQTKVTNSLENEFLNKMNNFIELNIDNSSFTVEVLADELAISRVQLYRKVKALLGVSISDYIQEKRLNKSKVLLLENISIADVAYSVGFSSPNYFSTAFKNKFGKTPKQFKKEEKSI